MSAQRVMHTDPRCLLGAVG